MKRKKLFYLIALPFLLATLSGFSQDSTKHRVGKLYGDVFLNANHNFSNTQTSFRLNRLHVGYKYHYNDKLYFNGMIESAREDYEPVGDYNGITNLFEFCLGFKLNKIEGKAGLIGGELNQLQEKLWQHRYVDKVYADKYGFAPTNDFGAIVIYKPFDLLNIDFSITNGEGHKSGQIDSTFRYAAGITFKIDNGFIARLYSDISFLSDTMQTNLIAIIGYASNNVSIGIEYNQQYNSQYVSDQTLGGVSAYASYNFIEKFQIFGRYDMLSSNNPTNNADNWNINNDGQLIIAGLQYQLHEQITLSLNNRNWISDLDNKTSSYIFLDAALNF